MINCQGCPKEYTLVQGETLFFERAECGIWAYDIKVVVRCPYCLTEEGVE